MNETTGPSDLRGAFRSYWIGQQAQQGMVAMIRRYTIPDSSRQQHERDANFSKDAVEQDRKQGFTP